MLCMHVKHRYYHSETTNKPTPTTIGARKSSTAYEDYPYITGTIVMARTLPLAITFESLRVSPGRRSEKDYHTAPYVFYSESRMKKTGWCRVRMAVAPRARITLVRVDRPGMRLRAFETPPRLHIGRHTVPRARSHYCSLFSLSLTNPNSSQGERPKFFIKRVRSHRRSSTPHQIR
jgi:hypothetical protein